MLEEQIVRENKELEKRMMREVFSKNLLIIFIIIEKNVVK